MNSAPDHLDDPARRKWSEVLQVLQERGPVDQGQLDALAAYATAWSRWTAAEARVNELGAVVKSPAGFAVPNPYVAIAAAAQRQMRQWGDVLGLAKGRSRRKAKEEPEPEGGILKLLGKAKAKQRRA